MSTLIPKGLAVSLLTSIGQISTTQPVPVPQNSEKSIQHHVPKILEGILPFSLIPNTPEISPYRLLKLKTIEMIKASDYEGVREQLPFLEGLDKEAVKHTLSILETPHEENQLQWSTQLTIQQLKGDLSYQDDQVENLYQKIMNTNTYSIERRESNGHSRSFFLIDKEGHPFAILKQNGVELKEGGLKVQGSSFDRVISDLNVSTPVYEHELIGYEQDQLFGFNTTPATILVKFVNDSGDKVMGIVQEYIYPSKAGSELLNPPGATRINNMSKSNVHQVALSGLFKGLTAAHQDNYILTEDRIYEIDLEEMLLPYNRLSRNKAEESIILCRMWILGFPQAALPFDKASLMAIAHPSLPTLLENYQKKASNYTQVSQDSWNAQKERLEKMQQIAKNQLEKEEITLTPRDLYFELFGGKHIWEIAQAKGYPPLIAFNQIISDPYQHTIKDFEHPEHIPDYQTWLTQKPSRTTLNRNFYNLLPP